VLFRRIVRRKLNDPSVKVIVCEPRKTNTSKIADLWLPVDPGTDLAVFHCIAREIIKNNWHNKNLLTSTQGSQMGKRCTTSTIM